MARASPTTIVSYPVARNRDKGPQATRLRSFFAVQRDARGMRGNRLFVLSVPDGRCQELDAGGDAEGTGRKWAKRRWISIVKKGGDG